jgi:hypothetical protein
MGSLDLVFRENPLANPQVGASREQILQVEKALMGEPDKMGIADYPLEHYFAQGVYGRKILIPADTMMTGRIHKHACINVITKGVVSVITHDTRVTYAAPATFISSPGSKRLLYTHEETHWMTFHCTEETNIDKIVDEFSFETFEDYDNFINTQQRLIVHNGQLELF